MIKKCIPPPRMDEQQVTECEPGAREPAGTAGGREPPDRQTNRDYECDHSPPRWK